MTKQNKTKLIKIIKQIYQQTSIALNVSCDTRCQDCPYFIKDDNITCDEASALVYLAKHPEVAEKIRAIVEAEEKGKNNEK